MHTVLSDGLQIYYVKREEKGLHAMLTKFRKQIGELDMGKYGTK